MSSAARVAWNLAYQKTPIFLQGGLVDELLPRYAKSVTAIGQLLPVGAFSGGLLPIIALTEAKNFLVNLFSSKVGDTLDRFAADFYVNSGATLIENEWSQYPFASIQTAANSALVKPLQVSLRMVMPERQKVGMITKPAVFAFIKKTLDRHIELGGRFLVLTPAYYYFDCLLVKLSDVGGEGVGGKQPQIVWEWSFIQPIVSKESATNALAIRENALQLGRAA